MGNRKNNIEDAFNYNKGKPVKKWITGETLQRKRPYDWTAVTDHSEYMSIMDAVSDPKSPLQKDPIVMALKTNDPEKMDFAFKTLAEAFIGGIQYEPFNDMKILRPAWEAHKEAINKRLRARQVHHPDRLRVDLDAGRSESASQCLLPR